MQKRPIRLLLTAAALLLCLTGMIVQLFYVMHEDSAAKVSVRQGKYHINVPLATGTIYDRNMKPLNHGGDAVYAVVNPTPDTLASIFTKLRDRDSIQEQLQQHSPFVCLLNENARSTENLWILHGAVPPDGVSPAQHLLGYRQNGKAVTGLELSFADWLGFCDREADITFSVSALGEVLAGADRSVIVSGAENGGIVTTLDADIQIITERALAKIAPKSGAAVVMEIRTGNIAACASVPVYDPTNLSASMQRDDAPFLNRALCAYNVGSIFKLVTASAALESGIPVKHMYECDGSTTIYGQRFRCHKWNGHGLLDMRTALIESCNPYFIELSRLMTPEIMHDTAAAYGFGQEIELANGLVSSGGYLQSVSELSVEAEKANMSFGQGKLLASPLQITAMTACIANDGIYSEPNLVQSLTKDGKTLLPIHTGEQRRAVSSETAAKVRRMMVAVIEKSKTTNAKPDNVRVAGKTSTAQTGQYDEDGNELCHAWITGFFPVNHPRYAVTVFVEYGGYGNQAAAPVFREIIGEMTDAGL